MLIKPLKLFLHGIAFVMAAALVINSVADVVPYQLSAPAMFVLTCITLFVYAVATTVVPPIPSLNRLIERIVSLDFGDHYA